MEDELLQRARRLCLAAQQIQLPVLLSCVDGEGRKQNVCEETMLNGQIAPQNEATNAGSLRLPMIATLKDKQTAKASEEIEKKMKEDFRRLVERKKRKERAVEKVKHAQERAKARVARTNQLKQQQTRRVVEQQNYDAVSAAEQCTEKIRTAQQSRRQAKERVRMKQEEKNPETLPRSAPQLTTKSTNTQSFQRKPMKQLQISTQENERQSISERNEDIISYQKVQERKLRLETSLRLRRMKQLAENQKRQEQDEYEQGLLQHKSKLRELDRVAKGLSKPPPVSQFDDPAFETDEPIVQLSIRLHSADTPCIYLASNKSERDQNQEEESSSDSDNSLNEQQQQLVSCSEGTEPTPPQTPAITSRVRIKLPPWKQPPVPILPTHCYSYKAIIPGYSRVSVTAPGYTIATVPESSTRLRAQEISRQRK